MTAKLLEHTGQKYDRPYYNMDDLLAKHGRAFEWKPGKLPKGVRKGKLGNCYREATWLALDHGYRYVEGYADSGLIPMHHAWVIDEDDRVIDRTWASKTEDTAREYFGVIVPDELLRETISRTGAYGVLDDPHLYEKEWQDG